MKSRSVQLDRAASHRNKGADPGHLRVSFEFLDWKSEEFFVHGFDAEFYIRLFACIQTLQTCTRDEVVQQTHPGLRCKPIFRADTGTHAGFPPDVIDKVAAKLRREIGATDPQAEATQVARHAFEVSMGKNQGRLHGFVWEQSFNLVWFDPAHNLYPGACKVRGPKDLMLPKSGSHAELLRCKEENERLFNELERLSKEHQELMTVWAAG